MKVLVEAYGCTLNRGEAREFTEELASQGHEPVSDGADDADVRVIFTCGVIETTEKHMLKRIGQLASDSSRKLIVCGCLVDINPDGIRAAAPRAVMIHTGMHLQVLDYLGGSGGAARHMPERDSAVGILPISTGCSGACTYCITRKARGALRSRTPEEIRHRLEWLVSRGSAEIQICAEDTAIYGMDMNSDLGNLTGALETLEGDFMMRIGMMNPASAGKRLESILAAYENPRVFKFLHLPVQSGSDSVLRAMNRGYGVPDFIEIIDTFRARFPELTLSTDIIVGFPGEADSDFQASVELMEHIRPDIINITRFSPRSGTPAEAMDNQIPGRIAKERSRKMTELRFEITGGNYQGLIGRRLGALATERRVAGTTFLRTVNYRPVVVESVLKLGTWHEIEITGSERTHLTGRIRENV